MRGDSLRDFYAKTLAVVGLGLLAGAGAIVDYWPVGGPLPAVRGVAALTPAPVQTWPALPATIPAPVARVASRRAIAPIVVTSVPVVPGVAQPIEWPADPPAPPAPVAPDPVAAIEPIRIDDTPLPPASIALVDLGPMPAMNSGSALDDAQRIVGGAVRRTRESLKGARWFLGDKIQGLAGAFRKVSPFWDAAGPQLH